MQYYYDRPTLRDLVEQNINRRTKQFLHANGVTMGAIHEQSLNAYEELSRNTDRAEEAFGTRPDYLNLGDQFMVERIGRDGRLHLIMFDI